MLIYPENEWNKYDSSGTMLPYYTHDSLAWIEANIPKNVTVLEIGGGNSTIWWRKNAAHVDTIECDHVCAQKLGCQTVDSFLIADTVSDIMKDYDVVIVDGDGDRESYILSAYIKCKQFFIVDNWQQSEVSVYSDAIVSYLTENTSHVHIFKQHNHKDWKTAIFIK